MTDPVVDRIQKHPKYLELRRKRNVIGWSLTLLMMVVYYGYIALIAFNKPFLAQPIGAGVTSLGIPIGLGVIIFTVVARCHHGGGDAQKRRGRHVVAGNRQPVLKAGDAAATCVEVGGRFGFGRGPLGNEQRGNDESAEHADGDPVGGLLCEIGRAHV